MVHLYQVLTLLRQHCLSANTKKCFFDQPQLDYLGYLITAVGVAVDPDKIISMQNWPQPTNLKQLRGFLGLTGYYKKIIKRYVTINKLLTDMLKKDAFQWSPAALQSFVDLKGATTSAPILPLQNFHYHLFWRLMPSQEEWCSINAIRQIHCIL
ncbi:uncharacterized protein LOC113346376 [Papaver somniferum]|uniref:uncharacterized protein LOC113346376 n=1 Tax=Papaver somniferum TaxID=3469 RepID=UPI000E6FF97D|nr:uncharacterized protein LOC113346376 [Papaver somniferum]